MAVDIGPKIGIDGEAEFRKEINSITQQIKTFGSEMKAVTSEFADNEESIESLTAKHKILEKTFDAQEKKVEELKKGLAAAAKEFGEADSKTQKWQQAVYDAEADLNKLKNQLKQSESAIDNFGKEVDDAADVLEEAGDEATSFGDLLKANLTSDAIMGAVRGIVNGFKEMAEESREYRKIMGSLETSSEKAGYAAEETKDSYEKLYGVLGDNQTAATTTANLQAIGLEQEKLQELIDSTVGAWATYGDSIPIDGLAEAINHTSQLGEVQGTLADVLEWAGMPVDDFNAKLAECGTVTERADAIMQMMAEQGLTEAGKKWQETNASLVEANKATSEYEAATAKIGETVEPILTEVTKITADIMSLIADNGPIVIAIIAAIGAGFLTWNVASMIQGTSSAMTAMKGAITAVNAAMAANPIAAVTTLIVGIVAAIVTFIATNEEARAKLIEVWEVIRTTVAETAKAISGKAKEIGSDIKNGIKSGVEYVEGLPRKFKEWGADMISNLVSGIRNGISNVREAIGDIAGTIREYIHFSEPDVGPLSDFHTYMPDMTKMLTSGIRAGIPDIKAAMNDMTKEMVPTYSNGTAAAYDRLATQMGNLQIVLDDGTLVGKLSPKIDTAIGGYTKLKGRYNT